MGTHAKFYALLKQMPYATKAGLILQYSKNQTESLRDFYKMFPAEYSIMLRDMENTVNNTRIETVKPQTDIDEPKKRKLRSLILRAMQDQGVTVVNRDWSAVNSFVSRYAGIGKSLSNMSLDELTKFNKQVHKLLDWHKAKQEKQIRIASLN